MRELHDQLKIFSTIDCCRFFITITFLAGSILCQAAQGQDAADYWETPVSRQNPAPPAPETCGACHADKYSEWSGSRHAHAFSPGLIGQIIDYQQDDASDCLNCHAPLAEQQDALLQSNLEDLAINMKASQPGQLAQHGVFCAACHLRDGVLNAPSITSVESGTRVHQYVKPEPLLRDSLFCAACHQFDADTAVNGKPLQNTYREWLDSPYAGQGKTCQHCHMPNRAHLFRGIHDLDMVRQGLTITTQPTETSIDLVVRSTNIGHRFPSYSVPRVRLIGTLLDSDGRPIPGAYHEKVIQRRMSIDDGDWVELSDNRLQPGDSVTLSVPLQHADHYASAVNFRIIVEPEWFYHDQVYPSVLAELEDGPARYLIKQAKSLSESHIYVLFEKTVNSSRLD